MNELTDEQIAREAALKLPGAGSNPHRQAIGVILAAITAAKQQNDTARLAWMCHHCTEEFFESLPDDLGRAREFIDAARGVQPAAKEESAEPCFLCGGVGGHRENCPAAKQESAPASEQEHLRDVLQSIRDLAAIYPADKAETFRLIAISEIDEALAAPSPAQEKRA